ncbi:MAG: RNA polymerase sigma-70 factor [Thermoanaerobaculia bacterium]
MSGIGEFETWRPMLFSIAYRMLGSATEAEDVVQDAWLRAAAADDEAIRSPRAWLGTVVTRLALDRLKSARAQREEYIGPWLPEPILTGPDANPHESVERMETITFAFLSLLESLAPAERAAFVLREAFDYEHAEIAQILETSPANARQLVHRARAALAEKRPRFAVSRDDATALVERFRHALTAGDVGAIAGLLTENVSFRADGGGKAASARVPVEGRDAVTNLFAGFIRIARERGLDARTEIREINAEPAIVIWVGDALETVFSFAADPDGIVEIRAVRNPDKLARLRSKLQSS